MTNTMNSLLNMPASGIAAFTIDSVDGLEPKIYLFFSTDLVKSLAIHVSRIRDSSHDCDELYKNRNDLKLDILSDESNPIILRSKYLMFLDKYKKLGYKDLRNGYTPIKFEIKYEIERDYRNPGVNYSSPEFLVYVKLVSRRYEKYVVGVFNSMDNAREWGDKLYGNREFIYPINAENELTREFLSRV